MREFYALMVIGLTVMVIFKFVPIYGILIAFKDYNVTKGIIGSPWNNFRWFAWIFEDFFFWRVVRNTVVLAFLRLAFAFPAPIVLALLLNEIRWSPYKRTVQTISYLPHFMSWVVLGGIVKELLSPTRGALPHLFTLFGMDAPALLTDADAFRAVLVVSGIWQGVGWGTILYLAALSGVDPQLYESAAMDGANRFHAAIYISLPSLVPVMTILFLLQIGNVLEQGFDQILNVYNPAVYEVADVFETLVYREGIGKQRYSYATAIQLFQNGVGMIVLIFANQVIRRYNEYGVW